MPKKPTAPIRISPSYAYIVHIYNVGSNMATIGAINVCTVILKFSFKQLFPMIVPTRPIHLFNINWNCVYESIFGPSDPVAKR